MGNHHLPGHHKTAIGRKIKVSADLLVKAYHDTFGMLVLITRRSNNYNPYLFPEKLIPLMINNALSHKSLSGTNPYNSSGREKTP